MEYQRTYSEYNLDDVLEMGVDSFREYLSNEDHSFILVYRLLELRSNFEDIEGFEYCHEIQSWFELHNVSFDK